MTIFLTCTICAIVFYPLMVRYAEPCPPDLEECEYRCRRTECSGCSKVEAR